MDVSKTSDHIHIKIKMPNPSQEASAPTIAQNQNLKDLDVLCTFKIKKERQNLEYECIKDHWTYQNQNKDANPQLWTYSPHHSPNTGLEGHRCSLHLQNRDREPKFVVWVYQRPVTIPNWRSRCWIPVRNLQPPSKPQIRTWRTWMFFALSKSR